MLENLTSNQLWLVLTAVAVVAFILGRGSGGGASPEERAERQMREQQEAEQLFANLAPEVQQKVDERIQAGKKIEAIKLLREHSGAGLKASKQAVDMRQSMMGA